MTITIMEDKVKRESKQYLDKMFKKMDTKGIGAITIDNMRTIIADLVPIFNEEELEEMLAEVKKECSFVERNPETRKFDMKKVPDTIDFPSALAIAVHFLTLHEKKSNRQMSFSGRSLVRLDDMPSYKDTRSAVLSKNLQQQVKPTIHKQQKRMY